MQRKVLARIERVLVAGLIASLLVPLALGLYFQYPWQTSRRTTWLRNATLAGKQVNVPRVRYTVWHVLSGKYQASLGQTFNTNFYGRELFIRTINEIYLRLFHVSPVGFLIGPHLALFEEVYPNEYCRVRSRDPQEHRPLIADLRRFQDICAQRGVAFCLVVTPMKASIYPEWMPFGWSYLYKPGHRYYDDMIPLLREYGIHYVDGHVITAELKKTSPVSIFPLGGIHWGDPAALATTNAMIDVLKEQGVAIEPLTNITTRFSMIPHGQDGDLASALNTLAPFHYPLEIVSVHRQSTSHPGRPTLVSITGSFGLKMLDFLDASHQFSEIECYDYYKVAKRMYADGVKAAISEPTGPVDFASEIYAAKVVMLELNETAMPGCHHIEVFLKDALAAAPPPNSPPVAFKFESRMHYNWGNSISFATGDFLPENARKYHPEHLSGLRGFTPPGDIGAFTEGTVASIHFGAPPPPLGDEILEIDAKPFVAPPKLMQQRVDVAINGHPIGGWDWNELDFARKTLRVPREFLAEGDVVVEFQMADPAAPADFGQSADSRRLGLLVQRVRLRPAAAPPGL